MARLLLFPLSMAALVLCVSLQASAQDAARSEFEAGKVEREQVDETRLDVSRLPAEAIPVTRDLYAHGLFVEAQLGALGFVGDLGKASNAGPRLSVNLGYELTVWLSVLLQVDASFHDTKNRPPPSHTTYEMLGSSLGLRFTAPINARAALWLSGLAGMVWTGGDVLHALGFRDTVKPSMAYGGELGFDWHVLARHHSLGVLSGARSYAKLARDGYSLGIYGALYVRYVF